MKKTFFVILVCFFLLLSVCKKSQRLESQASVEVIGGVTYIHNTEVPLHPDKTVTFEEDLAIGGEDIEGNIVLFQPSRFIVDQHENIYISDRDDRSIKVFDQKGKHFRTIGRKGQGPGEFRSISYLALLPDGRLLVMDSSARRTSIFDSSGNFIESFQWQKRFVQLYLVTNSSYILSEYTYDGDNPLEGRRLFIKEFDFKGNELLSFGEFRLEKMKIHSEQNRVLGISYPYSPHSVFAADQSRQYLYHCLNDKYIIEVFDKTGKVIRKIDRPYKPVPFTSKDADEYRARYERSRNEIMRKLEKEMPMPNIKTITPRMKIDDLGNLWIETYEQKKEGDQTSMAFDVFNPDGYYDAKVWFDIRPALFIKGKMYRMETDEETGYRILKRYRVIWN